MMILRLTALAVLAGAAARAEPLALTSGPQAVGLLELYTSEGCSSCPPAEAWLGRLAGDPGLWRDFVPVARHVTYWDRLGWPDPFADEAHTAQQRRYAAANAMRSVYTPGFFWQGREWRGFFDRQGRPGPAAGHAPGTLAVESPDRRAFAVRFDGPGRRVHLAWLAVGVVQDVPRGENGGRRLRQDFVAAALASADLREGRAALTLPRPSLPAQRWALAAWVEDADGRPLQAAGAWAAPD